MAMACHDDVSDDHRSDIEGSMLPFDGAGDGVARRKGKAKRRSTPTTPGRRGGRRSTPGRPSTTPSYTTTASCVTDILDVYTGPPAAAFTTLRFREAERFKAKLQQIQESAKQVSSYVTFETAPTAHSLQYQISELRVDAKHSPADSATHFLTPVRKDRLLNTADKQLLNEVATMAPVREIIQADRDRIRERNQQVEAASDSLKDVIHNFYEVQAQVQGYVSENETRDVLINTISQLSRSLADLSRASSGDTIANTFVPPEVIDYVDDGRNPDIYTRELVEVVQRGNAVLNGKMKAFSSFSEVFADDLRKMSPEMAKAVDEITGGAEKVVKVKQENGANQPR